MGLVICPECKTQISDTAVACPKCGAVRKPKKRTSIITWIIAAFAGIWLVGFLSVEQHKQDVASGVAPPSLKQQIADKLDFSFSWKRAGFDTVLELDGTVTNKSDHDIRDFKVGCTGFGASGTQIDKNEKVFYDIVKRGETKHFPEMSMGFVNSQVYTERCGIHDFVIQ